MLHLSLPDDRDRRSDCSEATQRLSEKEQQLWDRQDALFQRELQRWERERLAWTTREAALTQQIAELQNALVQLALTGSSAARPGAAAAPSAAAAAPAPDELAAGLTYPDGSEAVAQPPPQQAPLGEPGQLGADFAASTSATPLEALQIDAGQKLEQTADGLTRAHGPPPKLVKGDDDVFWVNQLQAGLVKQGFSIEEEELEDWIFGEATENALLTFQVLPPLHHCCPQDSLQQSPADLLLA